MDRVEKYIKAGERAFESKDYPQALSHYKFAYHQAPRRCWLLTRIGLTYAALKKHREALEHFLKYASLRPEDYHGYLGAAKAYYRLSRYDRALEMLEKASRLAHDEPEIYVCMSFAHYARDEMELAVEAAEILKRLDPENPSFSILHGHIAYKNQDYEKAADDYQQGIDLIDSKSYSKFPSLYCNMGQTQLKLKNYDRAAHFFDQALKVDPKNAEALGGLAKAELKLKDYQSAIKHVDEARQLEPEHYHYCNLLSHAYFELGLQQLKRFRLISSLRAFALSFKWINRYGNIVRQRVYAERHHAPVIEPAPDLSDSEPSSAEEYIETAERAIENKAYEAALRCFKAAYKIDPEQHELLKRIGSVFNRLDKPQEALNSYLKYIALEPEDYEGYLEAGRSCGWLGRFDKATDMLAKAQQITTNKAETAKIYAVLGGIDLYRHETALALESLKTAKKLDPNNAEVYY